MAWRGEEGAAAVEEEEVEEEEEEDVGRNYREELGGREWDGWRRIVGRPPPGPRGKWKAGWTNWGSSWGGIERVALG